MIFNITDINRYISSFLSLDDTVSFLKSSRDLRNDLHDIPFTNFVFSEKSGMNEIKGMMNHLDTIETIEFKGCDFVDHLLLPIKNLKRLVLTNCKLVDIAVIYKCFKTTEVMCYTQDHCHSVFTKGM